MPLSDASFLVARSDFDAVLQRTEPLWRSLNGSRIFITGATGFFGSWLLGTALHAIETLRLDIKIGALSRDPSRFIVSSPQLGRRLALTWTQGDISSFPFPEGEWSHVIHGGAEASSSAHATNPIGTFDSIVDGTRRALNFAKERGVKRFLNVSSGAIYGRMNTEIPFPKETYTGGPAPLSLRQTYAEAKRAAENLTVVMAQNAGFETVTARCFAFTGPFQPMKSTFAIGNFIADAVEGKPIVITGDGSPLRSYLYAADLAEQLWTLVAHGNHGEAYNVGSQDPIDLASLAHLVKDLLGAPEVQILQARNPSIPRESYVPDVSKIGEQFQFGPGVSLEQAILTTAEWYRLR